MHITISGHPTTVSLILRAALEQIESDGSTTFAIKANEDGAPDLILDIEADTSYDDLLWEQM